MACDLGESEEHERIVSRSSDGSVLRPVVCKVMDCRRRRSLLWASSCCTTFLMMKHSLTVAPFWIAGRCHYLNERSSTVMISSSSSSSCCCSYLADF
jgi:hypothetical protein